MARFYKSDKGKVISTFAPLNLGFLDKKLRREQARTDALKKQVMKIGDFDIQGKSIQNFYDGTQSDDYEQLQDVNDEVFDKKKEITDIMLTGQNDDEVLSKMREFKTYITGLEKGKLQLLEDNYNRRNELFKNVMKQDGISDISKANIIKDYDSRYQDDGQSIGRDNIPGQYGSYQTADLVDIGKLTSASGKAIARTKSSQGTTKFIEKGKYKEYVETSNEKLSENKIEAVAGMLLDDFNYKATLDYQIKRKSRDKYHEVLKSTKDKNKAKAAEQEVIQLEYAATNMKNYEGDGGVPETLKGTIFGAALHKDIVQNQVDNSEYKRKLSGNKAYNYASGALYEADTYSIASETGNEVVFDNNEFELQRLRTNKNIDDLRTAHRLEKDETKKSIIGGKLKAALFKRSALNAARNKKAASLGIGISDVFDGAVRALPGEFPDNLEFINQLKEVGNRLGPEGIIEAVEARNDRVMGYASYLAKKKAGKDVSLRKGTNLTPVNLTSEELKLAEKLASGADKNGNLSNEVGNTVSIINKIKDKFNKNNEKLKTESIKITTRSTQLHGTGSTSNLKRSNALVLKAIKNGTPMNDPLTGVPFVFDNVESAAISFGDNALPTWNVTGKVINSYGTSKKVNKNLEVRIKNPESEYIKIAETLETEASTETSRKVAKAKLNTAAVLRMNASNADDIYNMAIAVDGQKVIIHAPNSRKGIILRRVNTNFVEGWEVLDPKSGKPLYEKNGDKLWYGSNSSAIIDAYNSFKKIK